MTLSTMVASVSSGVMNSLLEKLNTLMGDEYSKLRRMQNKIASLRDELSSMNALLVKLAEMDEIDVQAKMWRDQVRDMSYDIEDCIDDFMHDLEARGPSTGFINAIIESITKLMVRYQIANKIQGIEARINELNDRRKRYKLDECTPPSSIVPVDPRALAIFAEAAGLVGIDAPRDELVELLMDQDQELKVVSIVGFGGLGKTTLASEVCRKIQGHFTWHAFVSVSLKPDIPRLLHNLLLKLTGQQSSESSNLDDVIKNIREYLVNKRYFIVVDDLWDPLAWEIIKCAFPENNLGCRVLTTTRINSVAAACCSKSRECVYKMKSLNEKDSRKLFFSRIFGSGEPCPGELEEIANDILKKSGGLPLAIISISSLLADQPKLTFEYVQNSLGFIFDGNPTLEQMRKILELSYRDLPHHLKTCLLYLGMYPEDHVMDRNDLLRQWIAEGFVCATPRLHAEDVAICYFNELINRSMIQPVFLNDYYKRVEVMSCRVHDIMLDFIRSKIEEDNFIAVINDPEVVLGVHEKIRRVSMQCRGEECTVVPAVVNGSLSKVRSVMFFGVFSCPSLTVLKLKYVRVIRLDMDGNEMLDVSCISRLFLLRYLKISGCTQYARLQLPSQIGMLRQLETLDLRGAYLFQLPSDIVSLPRLSHLLVAYAVLPDGIGRLRSLRTLFSFDLEKNSIENIEGLGELTNLRDFDFCWRGNDLVEGARRMDLLRCSLERISCSLRSLSTSAMTGGLDGWSTFSPPPIHLRVMRLLVKFSTFPEWTAHLRDLQVLRLEVRGAGFNDHDIAILSGLPSLLKLSLLVIGSPEEGILIPGCSVALPALEAGAMPRVQSLTLYLKLSSGERGGFIENLLDIEHLPAGLTKIEF